MVEYRSFTNSDPPRLVALWEECGLGRGAASGISPDVFEMVNFSQPYFDPHGLTVAWEEDRVVGFAHAGFGSDASESQLDPKLGVIAAVLVAPPARRRGIGRELVARSERYLQEQGATSITAGPAPPRDSFYVGIYGGSRPAGFLESDPDADPFFRAIGFEPVERHQIFQRIIGQQPEPVSVRLLHIRRKMELAITDAPNPMSWWWATRYGRLDTVRFLLVPKGEETAVAALTVVGLDFYLNSWKERAVGLTDLFVAESERRKGYGQALVLEVCRRLKEELVTRVEAHTDAADEATVGLLRSTAFDEIDAGIVYRRAK